jgi:hypothetical protein
MDSVKEPFVPIAEKDYSRLGGWLVYFAIGLCVDPFILAYNIFDAVRGYNTYKTVFQTTFLPTFTVIGTLITLALFVSGDYFLIKRRRKAKTFLIWGLVLNVIVSDIITNAAHMDMNTLVQKGLLTQSYVDNWFNTSSDNSLGSALFLALILIPYFIRSKRVKATLVN